MAKLKFVGFSDTYVPKVKVPTEDGEILNRKQPKADRITCKVSLAPIEDKSRYLGSYVINEMNDEKSGEAISNVTQKEYTEWLYNECVEACCTSIKGLESIGITNGKTLVDAADHPFLQSLIQDIFFRAVAVRTESGLEEEDNSGTVSEKKD